MEGKYIEREGLLLRIKSWRDLVLRRNNKATPVVKICAGIDVKQYEMSEVLLQYDVRYTYVWPVVRLLGTWGTRKYLGSY